MRNEKKKKKETVQEMHVTWDPWTREKKERKIYPGDEYLLGWPGALLSSLCHCPPSLHCHHPPPLFIVVIPVVIDTPMIHPTSSCS